MSSIKFIVELTPPLNPRDVPNYYQKFSHLFELTKSFGIVSHAVGFVAGFDRAYNLAQCLRDKRPDADLLFHLTCRDLNRVNIRTRLTLLRELNIRKLLLVSGQNYLPPDRAASVHFTDSTQMAATIATDFDGWFQLAIAAYPDGIEAGECARLRTKLEKIAAVSTIYTQCIFQHPQVNQLDHLRQELKGTLESLDVVPGLPVFCDSDSLKKALRLTRGETDCNPLPQLDFMTSETAKPTSLNYLRDVCLQMKGSETTMSVYLCAFNRFELVRDLMESILRATQDR